MNKIRVLVVDDSAIVRKVLKEKLLQYDFIEKIDVAMDPYIAREKIASNKPDVILLDIEMPRMDGLTFLKHLMKSYPIPVIIVSSLLKDDNQAVIHAMELGAIDVVPKPGGPFSTGEIVQELSEKIKCASKIKMHKVDRIVNETKTKLGSVSERILSRINTTQKLIVIGASTGGTSALEYLFKDFQKTFPPVITVIHMPQGFTKSFAKRLNSICEPTIIEAENGMRLEDGHIYIAPGGDHHIQVKVSGAYKSIILKPGPLYGNHRPAIDILFQSVAKNIGKNCYGIILTGMGRDGAQGIKEIHDNGGFTIAQDEKSSIVFGMPKAAIELGAIDSVLPLKDITKKLIYSLNRYS